jgi:exopolysaccharide production protein ExoY
MEQTSVSTSEQRDESLDSHRAISRVFNTSILGTDLTHEPSLFYYASKRLLDMVLAALAIVVLIPLMVLIAICIKLADGGEILFFREIIGQYGQRFFALKFRTMIPNADAYLANHPELMQKYQQNMKLEHDPRVTKIGRFLRKTRLDELPQLFNVLVGQMSLVGPRMIHPSELLRYGEYAQKRLSVRPGITGLWQISTHQHNSYDERILLDMQYIDTRSFISDLAILVRTLKALVNLSGV